MALTFDQTVHHPKPEWPSIDQTHRVGQSIGGLIQAARPYQWAKNGAVVIIPGLAAFTLSLGQIAAVSVAVIAFCLAASSVYLLNDTLDRHNDALHPQKRYRPIASGVVTPELALAASAGAALSALALAALVSVPLSMVITSYLMITAAYSTALKHIPVLDVALLAAGFVLRVAAGAVAIGVVAPPMLLAGVFWAAALIALGKRRSEAVLLGANASAHRATLTTYTVPRLDGALVATQLLSAAAFTAWVYGSTAAPFGPVIAGIAGLSLYFALGAYRRSLGSSVGGDPTRDLAANPAVLSSLAVAGLAALSTGLI